VRLCGKQRRLRKLPKAGWVFRIEIVTEEPATKTSKMLKHLKALFDQSDLISESLVEELFESIKLFKKKESQKC